MQHVSTTTSPEQSAH